MKCISLWQPWASLISVGAKQIETRSWQTAYRGPLAIHAAKRWTEEEQLIALKDPFDGALNAASFQARNARRGLPFGAIVAVCRLVACVKIVPVTIEYRAEKKATGERLPHLDIRIPPGEPERSFGNYEAGRFAWILEDIRLLPEPLPFRGAQRLFDCDLPELLI